MAPKRIASKGMARLRPGSAADYRKNYNTGELVKALYRRHRITAPKPSRNGKGRFKEELIELMVDANEAEDKRGPFRFLDLPAEMRNAVYEYLLTLGQSEFDPDPDRESVCYPEILRSCKQILKEGHSIMYGGDQKLEVSLETGFAKNAELGWHAGDYSRSYQAVSGFPRDLNWAHVDWDPLLQQYENIVVTCKLTWRYWGYGGSLNDDFAIASETVHNGMNHLLYSLVSFIKMTKWVKKLELRLVLGEHVDAGPNILNETLWSLTRLGEDCKVTFVDVPKDVQDHIASHMVSNSSSNTAVYQPLINMMRYAEEFDNFTNRLSIRHATIVALLERGVSIMASTTRIGTSEASSMKQLLDDFNATLTHKKVQEMRTQITSTESDVLSELNKILKWAKHLRKE